MRCLDTDIVDYETVEETMTHVVLQWDWDVPEPDRVVFRGSDSECQDYFLTMLDTTSDNIDGMVVSEFAWALMRRNR